MSNVAGLFNYWVVIFLMMAGFFVVISQGNLVKKIIGLSLFQASAFILYISIGHVSGGEVPIYVEGSNLYSNPLPHVLILTAIVVSVSTTAVGLAIIIRIKETYNTVEEDEIQIIDNRKDDEDEPVEEEHPAEQKEDQS